MQLFSALEWIKIAIANAYGLDKKEYQYRIVWFNVNSHTILHNTEYYALEASEPMMFRKMCKVYQDVMLGKPTGALVGLDASTSGVQILSALTACYKGCVHTNLINDGKRHDLYGTTAEYMSKVVGEKFSRDELKDPLMTHFYNSTEQPKKLFGEGTPALKVFYDFLEKELPGASEAMVDITSMWNPEALAHTWKLPDGHTAHVPILVPVDKRIEIDELEHTTFTQRVYVNQSSDYSRPLASNVTHSVDSFVVREMIRMAKKQGFQILTIHDAFFCSPLYVNQMRKNYNYILSELCRQNVLSSILSQLCGEEVEFEDIDDREVIADLILNANYAIN